MNFDDNSEELRLLEEIKFKRMVAFVDDDDVLSVDFPPFNKNEVRETQNAGCQADMLNEMDSVGTQTRSKKSKEVQTEIEEMEMDERDINYDKIQRLFKKKLRLVEEAIEENNTADAFANYDVDWSEGGSSTSAVYTLSHQLLVKQDELQITALDWNSSGTTVFCCYGRYDHESVCEHKSALCSWNIDRIKLNPTKPDITIETTACITSVAAHPEYPAIVAIGLFSGEVFVYDIRQDDPLVASVTNKQELHGDEVTGLKWIRDPKSVKKKFMLLSSSRDGKMLVWNALPAKNQLKLSHGYLMLLDYLPKAFHKSIGSEMGITTMSINSVDKDVFLAGCDSGGIFKCSFSSELSASTKWDDEFPIQLVSPVTLGFDPQNGPVYAVHFSPFHRNIFLACGTDPEVKLYSLLQTSPLINYCCDEGFLYSVEWSPTRPCVFVAGSHKGSLLVFDLVKNNSTPAECIYASDKPVYAVAYNRARPIYVASGDGAGSVKIWRLADQLVRRSNKEMPLLNDISQKPFEYKE